MSNLELEIYENLNDYMEFADEENMKTNLTKEDKITFKEKCLRSFFLYKVKYFLDLKREDDFLRIYLINIKMLIKRGINDYYSLKSLNTENERNFKNAKEIEELVMIEKKVEIFSKKKQLKIKVRNIFLIIRITKN